MINKNNEPKHSVLTNSMDTKSKEFEDFKSFIDFKANTLSDEQKLSREIFSLRIKMEDYLIKDLSKKEIVLVGEFLRLFLEKSKIRQNVFAKYISMRPSNFSKILTGERKINIELSIILSNIFNVPSSIWMNIQTKNDYLKLSKSKIKQYAKFKLKDLV